MKITSALPIALAFALTWPFVQPLAAQEAKRASPGPADIVNAAPQEDWVVINPEEMLVMTLAPDARGNARRVVIQLMPPPFSQGWVENIKTLAAARWYDGTSINRVQDNYVVQWGDPGHDNPEGEGIAKKPLPVGLRVMGEDGYTVSELKPADSIADVLLYQIASLNGLTAAGLDFASAREVIDERQSEQYSAAIRDRYADFASFARGWPVAGSDPVSVEGQRFWPVHCYGMVGVGRNYSPDTGTGAELYTVIGHAPRHLDRNIALVGRIIGGMEHLSSLPRGSGALGFYTNEEADKRTPILSIRLASELPEAEQPLFEYLSTETQTFARYAQARANRRDPFFIVPAGGADICNIPVPVRAFEYAD
ncbi:MAG: peptidylprolyl isomerase [Pseudomonadota bacterium]